MDTSNHYSMNTLFAQLGLPSETEQINQFLSWHFKLNDAGSSPIGVDTLVDWRYELCGEQLKAFANKGFKP